MVCGDIRHPSSSQRALSGQTPFHCDYIPRARTYLAGAAGVGDLKTVHSAFFTPDSWHSTSTLPDQSFPEGLVCFLYITVNRCQEISPVLLLTARNWRYFGIPAGDRDPLQPALPRSSTLYIILQKFYKGELAFVEQEGRDGSCFSVARKVLIPLLQD